MSKYCGHAATIEHNGDVYSCDHFVFPEYRLGNIHDTPIINIMYSNQQRTFSRAKYTTLPGQCKRCKFLFACYGEGEHNFDGFDNIYVSYTVEQMTFGDYSIR